MVTKETEQPAVAQLIARLEEADAGNDELSWAIAEHLGWAKFWCGLTVFVGPGEWADKVRRDPMSVSVTDLPGDIQAGQEHPHYTTSLDAALRLVPEGMSWMVAHSHQDGGELVGARVWPATNGYGTEDFGLHGEFAKTAPLALCVAALRARQAAPPTGPVNPGTAPNTDESKSPVSVAPGEAGRG